MLNENDAYFDCIDRIEFLKENYEGLTREEKKLQISMIHDNFKCIDDVDVQKNLMQHLLEYIVLDGKTGVSIKISIEE